MKKTIFIKYREAGKDLLLRNNVNKFFFLAQCKFFFISRTYLNVYIFFCCEMYFFIYKNKKKKDVGKLKIYIINLNYWIQSFKLMGTWCGVVQELGLWFEIGKVNAQRKIFKIKVYPLLKISSFENGMFEILRIMKYASNLKPNKKFLREKVDEKEYEVELEEKKEFKAKKELYQNSNQMMKKLPK
ncbi:hypothetical protein RFI_25855 [Reticulomyxa filosa]|uniref:Uncharacterized protein n=1 Tax=Reticulomyxa filosa TaxID=46433 RepID=X6MCY1_RETFI|nr:hypothetical protein RFI_25855 [Reticulomyxa filosa]|eukprot:ETO11521.1 hypothetical protein RFI_25855 [Reticulomyxa filosa]